MQVTRQPLALQVMQEDLQVVEARIKEARGRAGRLALALGGPRGQTKMHHRNDVPQPQVRLSESDELLHSIRSKITTVVHTR